VQGDLWRVAGRGALSGGFLVLPLVFVMTRRHTFSSLGPFADAWWVLVVLAAVGLGFAIDALTSLWRLLRRTSGALESGYDATTVLRVAADVRKDMGFLLQGNRHFAMMEDADRERLATRRVLAAACAAAAGVWLPVVLGLALLAAARGWVGPGGLWMVTLLPAGGLYLAAGFLGALEDSSIRKARRSWFRQPWAQDLDAEEIAAWRNDLAARLGRSPAEALPGHGRIYRRWAVGVGALVVAVALPILTLVPTSAIGPLLALVAAPSFGNLQQRAARVEAYRAFRLESDPALDPQEAGRLLHSLLYVGSPPPSAAGERAPERRYDAAWLPGLQAGNPTGMEPHRWAEELFGIVAAAPSPELMAFLDGVASSPAHADLSRLARAAALDAGAGRWADPLPEGVSVLSLPVPRIGGIREGAYAHLAAAASDLARGREADAETKIREVISVGFLMADDGPTLIDNLVGHVVVGVGGTALERFYQATRREEDARRVRALAEAAARAAARVHTYAPEGTEAFVRSLPAAVADTGAVRGLRWESFILTTTLTPCLNLQRMVFGPEAEYRAFVARAHASLVRWPSEEQLSAVAEAGYWGAVAQDKPSLFGRFLGISMRPGKGSCQDVVKRFEALKEAM
jgi:hypothetical protein